MKNWNGNSKSAFTTLGASSHSQGERQQHDYYATEPYATELLLSVETFNNEIWECAVGEGHMADVLKENGYTVLSSDLIDRGYPETETVDFLNFKGDFDGDIITNPPYKYGMEFVEKALDVIHEGNKVAMFLKLQFLESQKRRKLFMKYPPKTVYVSSTRLNCAKNGDFEKYKSSAIAYAWFVWEKGHHDDPVIKWIN